MSRLTDTSPEAEQVLLEIHRRRTPGEKWLSLGELYSNARALHAIGVRSRNPAATPRDILVAWMKYNLGIDLSDRIPETIMNPEMLRDLREVLRILVQLEIPYALGGSMACIVHGIDRYTKDADITVEPFPGKEDQLLAALTPAHYVTATAMADALRRRKSFNIINTMTGFKIDVFVCKDEPFEQSAWARRRPESYPDRPEEPVIVHTPEDLILFKLRWYRLGNEISEQQWKDVLGVLQVQGEKLDRAYMEHWATELGILDLLERVRAEANPPS